MEGHDQDQNFGRGKVLKPPYLYHSFARNLGEEAIRGKTPSSSSLVHLGAHLVWPLAALGKPVIYIFPYRTNSNFRMRCNFSLDKCCMKKELNHSPNLIAAVPMFPVLQIFRTFTVCLYGLI